MRIECAHGHPQRGPLDYLPDGQCRHCDRDRQAKYQARRKEAMALYRALEAHGVDVTAIHTKADKVAAALADAP
jgi:GTP-binding protein EngB required for normal cell division